MFNFSLLLGLQPSEKFLVGGGEWWVVVVVVVVCKPSLVFSLGPKLNNIQVSSLKLSQLMMGLVPYFTQINISRVKINFLDLVPFLV